MGQYVVVGMAVGPPMTEDLSGVVWPKWDPSWPGFRASSIRQYYFGHTRYLARYLALIKLDILALLF